MLFLTKHTNRPSRAIEQYLLSSVQLLQDDAYVWTVLCGGACFRGDGTGWTFCHSMGLTQDREEGQTVTILPLLLLILFSFCSNFAQDLGLCYVKETIVH